MIAAPPHGHACAARGTEDREDLMAATRIRFGGYQGPASVHTRAIAAFEQT